MRNPGIILLFLIVARNSYPVLPNPGRCSDQPPVLDSCAPALITQSVLDLGGISQSAWVCKFYLYFHMKKQLKEFPTSSMFDWDAVLAKNLTCVHNLNLSRPGVLQSMRSVVLSCIIQVLQSVLYILHKQYSLVYTLKNLEAMNTWVGGALAGTLPGKHMEERRGEQCQETAQERSTFLILSQHNLQSKPLLNIGLLFFSTQFVLIVWKIW